MENRLFILKSVYEKILARKLVIDDEAEDAEDEVLDVDEVLE